MTRLRAAFAAFSLSNNQNYKEDKRVMPELDFDKTGGLIPAIAQDADTGEVLMLAYMNQESFEETLACGNAVILQPVQKKNYGKREKPRDTFKKSGRSGWTVTMTPCFSK